LIFTVKGLCCGLLQYESWSRLMSILWNVFYVVVMAAVVSALEAGALMTGDGFFLVASILAVFTGHWVIASEGTQPVSVASTRILSSGAAYGVCLALAGLVAVQALAVV
jgi:hypothetical protein